VTGSAIWAGRVAADGPRAGWRFLPLSYRQQGGIPSDSRDWTRRRARV